MIHLLILLGWLHFLSGPQPLEYRETISRTLPVTTGGAPTVLILRNISGHVTVCSRDRPEISLEIAKTIRARNPQLLQQGIDEITLVTLAEDSALLADTDAPFVLFARKQGHTHYHIDRSRDTYSFQMDYTVWVPQSLNLDVSTINNGEVAVEQIESKYPEVRNVNGQTLATTVNGDIRINYQQATARNCQYRAVNGDITLTLPEAASADVSFKSMNGALYTHLDNLQPLPAVVSISSENAALTEYRIDQIIWFRLDQGGPLYSLETLNGDVYLKHHE